MLTKSQASPYNITLILSLFFLIYNLNLMRIKLKLYKNNSGLIAKTKMNFINQTSVTNGKVGA